MLIEIAVTDFRSAAAAAEGGADRIELCAALSEGGITPSAGLIRRCADQLSIPFFPIIRPRSGDFLYNEEEIAIMKEDIRFCKALGCAGIVTGALKRDGSIDGRLTSALVELAYPMEVTFHRAFDRCRDPLQALETIIQAGCTRILTSGQEKTALEGVTLIKQLVQAADGRITIMPGSGVRPDNIAALYKETGADEFHASLKKQLPTAMEFATPAFAEDTETMQFAGVDPAHVHFLKQALLQAGDGREEA